MIGKISELFPVCENVTIIKEKASDCAADDNNSLQSRLRIPRNVFIRKYNKLCGRDGNAYQDGAAYE